MSAVVSLKSVVDAFNSLWDDETCAYVNSATGEVRLLGPEERGIAEAGEIPAGTPDWQRDLVESAIQVLSSEDWLALPTKFDIHEWAIMDRFAASLQDPAGAGLRDALRRKGAFGRFRSALRSLGIEDDWFRYREEAFANIARSWLEAHGLSYE